VLDCPSLELLPVGAERASLQGSGNPGRQREWVECVFWPRHGLPVVQRTLPVARSPGQR